MNKYTLGRQKTLAELCEEKDKQIAELKSELGYFIKQYGCECEHPACRECEDVKEAERLIGIKE